MKNKKDVYPWTWLDEYRGKAFKGEWPTLPEIFSINASRFPERRCFEAFEPEHLLFTYNEALTTIKKIAEELKHSGIHEGDKVGVVGKNSPEWALAYLGILFANAVVVPLDNVLPAHDLNKLCEFSNVNFIFADEDKLENIDKDLPHKIRNKVSLEKKDGGFTYILDWCKNASGDKPTFYSTKETDTAAILFTSGTTGFPKGVALTHKNFVSDAFLAQGNMWIYPTDVFYAILPIHHAYTMLAVFIETIITGAACVFGKRLVVSSLLHELKEGKVTMFLGVPMLFNKLIAGVRKTLASKGKFVNGVMTGLMNFSSKHKRKTGRNIGRLFFKPILKKLSMDKVRICISGGGPLPESTFRDFNALGVDFVQGYGMTETSPILTLNPTYAYIESSVGKVIPGAELKIVDPDSEGNGVIYAKGPMVMNGYYNNKAATDEVLSQDGWLCTGDVGHLDENNYLYLTGRAKNIIVTEGGKNVFPEEIEDSFQLYDDIEQILILPYIVNKETKAEGIRAIVKPTKDATVKYGDNIKKRIDEIIEEVNRTFPPYKQITMVDLTDEKMPVSSTMKIKRFEVAKKFALKDN